MLTDGREGGGVIPGEVRVLSGEECVCVCVCVCVCLVVKPWTEDKPLSNSPSLLLCHNITRDSAGHPE